MASIGSQHADSISNVGRDQHNHYVLRIAPMLERARRLMQAGVALMLAATGVYLVVTVLFGREIIAWNEAIFSAVSNNQQPDPPEISFAPLLLLPVATVLGFVGFVMVVSALLTRRRARQEQYR